MDRLVVQDDASLAEAIARIWDEAREIGLRPFPTHFEIVPATVLYEIGSYMMPGRFSHWTHGKMYQMQKTMYDYGLSKIYELVINTNPCWAFLLETNTPIQNRLIVAHVLGHSDFFANNAYFSRTSKRMIDTVTLNADRIRQYEYEHGQAEVERMLDAVLAIQEQVDPYTADLEEERPTKPEPPKRKAGSGYEDIWGDEPEQDTPKTDPGPVQLTMGQTDEPEAAPTGNPDRDLLRFIARRSPVLAEWERDVVQIVRGEMLYFFPQMQTKIVNEGWATLCHSTLLHRLNLSASDSLDFAELHSNVVQPGGKNINPYHLGYEILKSINVRHGGTDTTLAPQLFELREIASDVSLIRNELTRELVEDLDLFVHQKTGDDVVVTDTSWEGVRDRLVADLSRYGFPTIIAMDEDYGGRRELYLQHDWTGKPLDLHYARKTLEHVHRLWGRRVWLETRDARDDTTVMAYDPKAGHIPAA